MKKESALDQSNKAFSFWLCGGLLAILLASILARDIDRPFYGLHSWGEAGGAWKARNYLKYDLKYTKGFPVWAVGDPPRENPNRALDHPQLGRFLPAVELVKHNVPFGVTIDLDGQHQHEDIERLIRPILEDKYDLVIGSRILGKKEKSAFLRSFGVMFFTKIINALTGMKLADCSSGFKAFNISRMKQLELREYQFQSAEVIIEAAKKGLRIGEVPTTITKRKHGQSKKGRDWSYGVNFAKTIIKSWWR